MTSIADLHKDTLSLLDLDSLCALKNASKQTKQAVADALEAVIGAIYHDGGLEAARTAIEPLWAPLVAEQDTPPIDSKTALQEWAQGKSLALPDYRVVERTGPDHVPVFTVEVTVSGLTAARASAGSKRVAEQDAARALLAIIEADG